jgi:hypothetical protein
LDKYPTIKFTNEVIYWRGPAPFFFVRVPEKQSAIIFQFANQITYGWGVLPVDAKIKGTEFYTALFPKDGGYLLPLKKIIREELKVDIGDKLAVELNFSGKALKT